MSTSGFLFGASIGLGPLQRVFLKKVHISFFGINLIVFLIASQLLIVTISKSTPQVRERPGCHRIGHVREISIAGCLKFNISTTACRGHCVSYSIPAVEEIDNHSGQDQVASTSDNSLTFSKDQYQGQTISKEDIETNKLNSHSMLDLHIPEYLTLEDPTKDSLQQSTNLATTADQQQAGSGQAQTSSTEQSVQATTGGAGSLGETFRPDVVSVGRCCSMTEWEDVIVSVRCKGNKNRTLVFKSAKTCECFFCKHL